MDLFFSPSDDSDDEWSDDDNNYDTVVNGKRLSQQTITFSEELKLFEFDNEELWYSDYKAARINYFWRDAIRFKERIKQTESSTD